MLPIIRNKYRPYTPAYRQRGMVDALAFALIPFMWVAFGVFWFFVVGTVFAGYALGGKRKLLRIGFAVGITLGWFVLLNYQSWEHRGFQKHLAEAKALCEKDLDAISAEIEVSSVLVESGSISPQMLRKLIGDRGLRFVEIRAKNIPMGHNAKQKSAWGISLVGERSYLLDPGIAYVKISLSQTGDSHCRKRESRDLGIDMESAPFSPKACLRIDFEGYPTASHSLKALPISGNAKLIRWTLVEQGSGKALIALASAEDAASPRGSNVAGREAKRIGNGFVSCDTPHWSILDILRSRKNSHRLALVSRLVQAQTPSVAGYGVDKWPQIVADEDEVPSWSDPLNYRAAKGLTASGTVWEHAFREAEKKGYASAGEKFIDYGAGELLTPVVPRENATSNEGFVRWVGDGFFFIRYWHRGKEGIPVVRYSRDGKILWRAFVTSSRPIPATVGRFGLEGAEESGDDLLLYGNRSDASSSLNRAFVLRVTGIKARDVESWQGAAKETSP